MPRKPAKPDDKPKIIIKRVEDGGDGHHGGAWKVAYADFVTAMMAFFLLMWIINFVEEETKMGLTNYFSGNPSGATPNPDGSGGLFGGSTPHRIDGLLRETGEVEPIMGRPAEVPMELDEEEGERARPTEPGPDGPGGVALRERQGTTPDAGGRDAESFEDVIATARAARDVAALAAAAQEALAREIRQREDARFEEAIEAMREALRQAPGLAETARQILFQIEPDGLRIHFTDAEERPMFDSASATPNRWLAEALTAILPTIMALPNRISIAGHTDSRPFRGTGRTNWELSVERAIAVRRLLTRGGLPDSRIANVHGFADRQPLRPEDPAADVNRRITLLLLRN